jgi:hypothetical protein
MQERSALQLSAPSRQLATPLALTLTAPPEIEGTITTHSCCSGPHRGPHSEISWKFRPAHGLLRLYLIMLRIVWLGRRFRLSWLPGKKARLFWRNLTLLLGHPLQLRFTRASDYGTDLIRVVDPVNSCILDLYLLGVPALRALAEVPWRT